jgi:hypothetical protein
MDDSRDRAYGGRIIEDLLIKPPPGYVFVVSAAQDSHYDLFMLTLIRKAIELGMNTLEVVTDARNRELMEELSSMQSDLFQILETSYGQDLLGKHSCQPHLHEINIMLRELRNVLGPKIVIFEGLTPLLIDFVPRDVVQFFKESVEESTKRGSKEFYLVHMDTADKIIMNQLFSLAQGILSLSTSRGKHYLTIRKSTAVDLPINPIEYVPIMSSPKISQWHVNMNW